MIHLCQFPKSSVVSCLLPFSMHWYSLHLGEGIAVGDAQHGRRSLAWPSFVGCHDRRSDGWLFVGSFVGFALFVNTLVTLEIFPCWWKCSDFHTLWVTDNSFWGLMFLFSNSNSEIDSFHKSSHFPSWNFFSRLIKWFCLLCRTSRRQRFGGKMKKGNCFTT
jgi:hypothetical protein